MRNNHNSEHRGILPGELTISDIKNASRFLESTSPSALALWAQKRTKEHSYRGQDFNIVIDKPNGGNPDKAVVVMSEFGTNILPRLIAKSIITRDAVDPEATLVIQANSAIGEKNMNYSNQERQCLVKGDLAPIIGRIAVTLETVGNPSDITMYGISQGAVIGLDCASSDMLPPVALALYDTPTVVERSFGQLARDFAQSGKDLPKMVQANYENQESSMAEYTKKDTSGLRLAKWFFRSLHPDNLATARAMCHATASDRIEASLDKGSCVIHAWGTLDEVSPAPANKIIATSFENNPRYESRCLDADHSLADFYAFDGAIARLAHNLKTKHS